MAAQTQPVVQPAPVPYGAVYLPELLQTAPEKSALVLPLTFVYLLSMHLRFILPVSQAAIPVIDKILDEVLAGHSLESKGIVYRVVNDHARLDDLLRASALLITCNSGPESIASSDLPQAEIAHQPGKGPSVRLRNVERIRDEGLKAKLVGCAQLINIQSGGFLSEGHFSLSW